MSQIIGNELEPYLDAAADADRVYRDERRKIIVSLLNEIAADVSAAASDAGMDSQPSFPSRQMGAPP